MKSKDHYLQRELYALVKSDESILDFLQQGSLDRIWFWDLEKEENQWMSPRFWEVLGYDHSIKEHSPKEWQDIINQDDLRMVLDNFKRHCDDPNHPYDQIVRYRHMGGRTCMDTLSWNSDS
jgi:PAS domain-containing protein